MITDQVLHSEAVNVSNTKWLQVGEGPALDRHRDALTAGHGALGRYPVYYPEAAPQESPSLDPAPEVQREGVFSTGKYVLQSDGVDTYRWIWIPAVPEAPPLTASPAPPPVPSAPIAAAPEPAGSPQRIYHWTDEHGIAHWTNNSEAVPAKYRSQASSRRLS